MRALVGLAIVLAAATARGDVGVVVTGEATMQPQLATQLETWLRQHGHTLVSAPLAPEAINTLIDCFVIEDESCARKVIEKRAKAKSVVFARIEVQAATLQSAERTVTLTAYWFDKGKDAVAERRFCERCTELTLKSTADELMAALAGAGQTEVGRLRLTTTPAGARVTIDGRMLGLSPLDQSLSPGDHTVLVELPERTAETRRVTIYRTETTTLDIALAAPGRPERTLAYAAIGAGAAVLITGVVLLAIDEDVIATGPQLPEYRNTAPGGVALVAIGAAAAGVGGYLWWRSTRPRSGHPVAGIARGGGFVGWSARF
jgi:hypothetical protein